jgi:ubiquinone/menaquinone biosynthesis methyltransferase
MTSRPPSYDAESIRLLFDEMAATYGLVNVITSFGFAVRWRRQCLDAIPLRPESHVVDLMCGMGELVPGLRRRLHGQGRITAVDLSAGMVARARRMEAAVGAPLRVMESDVFANGLPDGCADAVTCSFGLKTLDDDGLRLLAAEVHRLLRPGGVFSFVEVSVPQNRVLRALYMFYLQSVIPLLGRLLLGNPDNYRMLGIYTAAFGNSARFQSHLTSAGLLVQPLRFFHGCASGAAGKKPSTPS